jgi:curved DNA-binding protein CbpA
LRNYYLILELVNFSSREAVKGAFKRLAFQYHPDRNPDNSEAEEMFKLINEAYRVLNDPNKKYRYDELLRTGATPAKTVVVNHEGKETTYYQRPNPDPRYRRRAPLGFTAKAREVNPYLPTNTQMGFIAVGLIIYLFFLVRTVFVVSSRIMYHLALEAVEQRNYRLAYDRLNTATANSPSDYQIFALKAKVCAEHLQYYYEAAECYTQAIKHAPSFRAEYFLQRGLALSHLRERKMEAIFDFNHATPYYLNEEKVLQQIADAYYSQIRNYDKALEYYAKLLRFRPRDPKLYQRMGDIELELKQYDRALAQFDLAIVLEGKSSHLYYQRAICHYFLQDKPRTCGDWQRAQQLNPNLRDADLEYFCNYKDG